MPESIGRRIAFLRQKYGWTQQSLADRLAISRVAISHIEMDLSIPSERSITLMAGVFKLSPTDLVADTTYPRAKAERLPGLTTTFTNLELNFSLLKNDLSWLDRFIDESEKVIQSKYIINKWLPFLRKWREETYDQHEVSILMEMQGLLSELKNRINIHLE